MQAWFISVNQHIIQSYSRKKIPKTSSCPRMRRRLSLSLPAITKAPSLARSLTNTGNSPLIAPPPSPPHSPPTHSPLLPLISTLYLQKWFFHDDLSALCRRLRNNNKKKYIKGQKNGVALRVFLFVSLCSIFFYLPFFFSKINTGLFPNRCNKKKKLNETDAQKNYWKKIKK